MARYNGLIIPRSYNDYYSRSDPQAIRHIVLLAADGELNAESKNPLQNQAIAKIVPVTASQDNKLIVQSQVSGLTADVATIKNIIPNTASETNELADKNFVNSTVGTITANYINKTDAATVQQALQLPGVLSGAVAAGDNKAVKSSAVNNALTNYRKKTDNSNEFSATIEANTIVKTTINVNPMGSQKIGFLLMIEGNIGDGDATYADLYLIRCGYSGNFVTAKLISSSGSKAPYSQTFGVSEDGYLTITSNIQVRYYIF